MPLLTELLGLEVAGADGRPVGRLHDLVVRVDLDQPPVVGVVLRGDDVSRCAAAPFDCSRPALGTGPAVDGLWLARDVLDTQVYNVRGHRISRVGDVVLELSESGAVVLSGVQSGLSPVLRRLGLPAVARRVRDRTLPWSELHPLSRRGHSLVLSVDPKRAQSLLAAARARRPHLLHRRAPR
jgi:sporulation protein YlmC with PRC-barrel domain